MSYKIIDVSKIVGELLDVLAKNEVPVSALDNILQETKNTAHMFAIIQKDKKSII